MALTQVSTAGVKDDAVTAGKIPANAVGSSELADNAVDTAAIAADAVTSAKIADNAVVTAAINADAVTGAKIADDAINSEHYTDGSIDTAHIADSQVTTAKIADDAVTNAKMADDAIGVAQLSATGTASSSTFLRGDNSWTAVNTDLVSDTSPQLGGDLQSNGNQIEIADDDQIRLGTGNDLTIFHESSSNFNVIRQNNAQSTKWLAGGDTVARFMTNGAVELYHDNSKKLETTSGGASVTGNLDISSGVDVTGDITTTGHFSGPDNGKLKLGAGDDLQLYHNGSDSVITNGTGNLYIQTAGNTITLQKTDGEKFFIGTADGDVELYNNGAKKLETSGSGGTLYGTWTGAGKILQVVTNTKTDTFSSTTKDAWTDITGATVTITPSSSSNKVFVMFSFAYGMDAYHAVMNFRIVRGTSTAVSAVADASGGASTFHSTTFGLRAMHDSNGGGFVTLTALNSPSSTSAETYKLQYYASQTGTYYLNRGENDSASYGRGASTFTAMEVAA